MGVRPTSPSLTQGNPGKRLSLPHSRPCSGRPHPAQPGSPVSKAPLGFPSGPQANQHRKPRQAIPLNHMEWKKGVCSQWYLGTELFQPSGSSLSRFLTPFNDFQKPGHFGPWGISNFPIIPLPDSCWNVPGVLGVGGHVIQLAWMSTGPSFQQALKQ